MRDFLKPCALGFSCRETGAPLGPPPAAAAGGARSKVHFAEIHEAGAGDFYTDGGGGKSVPKQKKVSCVVGLGWHTKPQSVRAGDITETGRSGRGVRESVRETWKVFGKLLKAVSNTFVNCRDWRGVQESVRGNGKVFRKLVGKESFRNP